MQVKNILAGKGSDVFSVGPGDDATTIARALAEHRIGAALVRKPDGTVMGIVSERDIVRALAKEGPTALMKTARDLMTADLHTVTPDTTVVEAMEMMTDRRCRHLPVLQEDKLAGMVSIGDLVKARIAEAEEEAQSLRAFVTAA